MKKDTNERMMSSRQKLVQMQYYWNNLAHTATDDMKKKSMKMRFGITNIKLDKKGGKLISFDEAKNDMEESEYQGRKVELNNPFRTPKGPKKFSVYVKNEKGNVVKVNFGDPNMEIKRDDPARRKSFRARHNCSDPGPKWKARYWSCYQWRASAPVDEEDPCWDGYVQVGMKKKNGKKVPNCVPEKK